MPAVRPADPADLRGTARLHQEQLPGGFFARLGPGFLRSYHATFLASPYGVAFVVAGVDGPVGFLVGTLDNRPHYRFVTRRLGARLAARGAAAMLARPPLAWLFLRTRAFRYARWILRYPLRRTRGGTAAGGDGMNGPTVAVLTHVAVSAAAQGNGSGRALVDAFVDAARAAGADEARLVTTADGPAERFYDRLGWTAGAVRPAAAGDGLVREYSLPLRENAAS